MITCIVTPRWTPVVAAPPLHPGALHVWKIACGATDSHARDPWPLLSNRERTRAEGLRFDHHRQRYVYAHAGLRLILSSYINIKPKSIEFKYGNAGKPGLSPESAQGVEFNMTTSGDLALVAVSMGAAVGIDCEHLRPRRDLDGIARRVFNKKETTALAVAPDHERLQVFYHAWTALEASVKADGRGLFRSRDVPPMPPLAVAHCIPEDGFIAAIARRTLPSAEAWKTLLLDDSG